MKTKYRIYIIAAVFLMAAIVLIVAFVIPLLKDISSKTQEIILDNQMVASLALQNNQLEDFKKNYEVYEADLKKVSQMFTNTENQVDFIKFLEKAAFESNVNVDISIISPPQDQAGPQKSANFRIFTKGTFPNVVIFSQKLETGPYLITIKSATIQGQQGEDGTQIEEEIGAYFSIEAAIR